MRVRQNRDHLILSAAFDQVFRKGRSPPSCPHPNESDLFSRIRDQVSDATDPECMIAMKKVRKLSKDSFELCEAYYQGTFGSGDEAIEKVIKALSEDNPEFSEEEYEKALSVGMMWAAF
jgi:hypothetical protein